MSRTKLNKLTPEQEARLSEFRNEYLRRGLSCDPADRQEAESAIADAYRASGLAPPTKYVWLASPMAGAIAAAMLADKKVGDQVWDQVRAQVGAQVSRAGYGHHDAGWLAFYAYFADAAGIADAMQLEPLSRLSAAAGWWWPFSDLCIITDRPAELHRDAEHRLHCETGMAIKYRDGWGVSAWHGTRIPDAWVADRAALTPTIALKWANIEQRRAACEILGWNAILRELKAKMINADSDPQIGELVEVTIPDIGKERFLRVHCGTGREFALPVPPNMQTALEANAWTYGYDTPETFGKPEVRT